MKRQEIVKCFYQNILNERKERSCGWNNFLNEFRPHTTNNGSMVSINELNAKSLIDRHSESGYIIVSPCRGYSDFDLDSNDPRSKEELARINNERIKEMIDKIKATNYSYTPTYGGFIENQGTPQEENVYERSFIIYNQDKRGNEGDFKELVKFGQELAKEYNQDSILVKAPNQSPKYITKDGDIDMELGDNVSFNDFSETYFTDLHKNTQKYAKDSGRTPTRFSYVECYINPSPSSLNEAHCRYMTNEVFLPYKSNNSINETSRKQKAIQAINGDNHRVKTIGILSAENPMGKKATPLYNKQQREELIKDLALGQYKYFKVLGNYDGFEHSVLVYNIDLETLLLLGNDYNQESVIFVDMTSENGTIDYQYWERSAEGKPLKLKRRKQEIVDANTDDNYYTQICKHFKFRIPFFESYEQILKQLNEKSKEYNVDKLINECLSSVYTGKHKYVTRYKLYGK